MKPRKGSSHWGRNIALVVLLAVLCVGGTELAACRHFAPEVYEQITAPVRAAASAVADAGMAVLDAGKSALSAAGQFCLDAAHGAARLAGQAAEQAAALASGLWECLTAVPEDTPPPQPSEAPSEAPEETPAVSRPPATDPPLTEVMEADGRQILTGGSVDVVYFCQSDEEWAGQLYGTDPIGPYGCGPTAMAMAVASMTDTETDPALMAAWAADHGYWARRSGSYHSIVLGTARAFGLEAEAFTSRDPVELRRALRDGGILVALMGPGHFTTGGHFILLRGTTLAGDILVADPNSLERSLQTWDPQIVLDELSSARDSGAPLWLLTAPSS